MSSAKLKNLNRRLAEINVELNDLRQRRIDLEKSENRLLSQARSLQSDIKKLTKRHVQVSEHAIVRYMERVHKLELNSLRDEIVGSDHRKLVLPSGQFAVGNTHKIRVKDGIVTTVIVKDDDNN